MMRDEWLFKGLDLLERKDWAWLNDNDIATLLSIHVDDFHFYFESKHMFEHEVIGYEGEQHLLDVKTALSCCFKSPVDRVKKYLGYLENSFATSPEKNSLLFAAIVGGIRHHEVSRAFVSKLKEQIELCLLETPEGLLMDIADVREFVRQIISGHIKNLKSMEGLKQERGSSAMKKYNEVINQKGWNDLFKLSL